MAKEQYNRLLSETINIITNNTRERAIEIMEANGMSKKDADRLVDKLNGRVKNEA